MTVAKPPSVICAGRLYCDLIFTQTPRLPSLGTEVFAGGLDLAAGGGAVITAACFAALGHETELLAVLPVAPFDKIVEADVAEAGLSTRHCSRAAAGSDPQITVAIANAEDRAFLSRRNGLALPPLNATTFLGARHLHIGELATLVEHPDLIALARAAGMSISLDCSWDDALMAAPRDIAPLIGAVDVFLPNAVEFEALEGHGIGADAAPLVVVKCGADGARAHDGKGWIADRAQTVPVVDSTGAGDAFNGGFLSAWLAGRSLGQALAMGNACGAHAVQVPGGIDGMREMGQAACSA